MSNNMPNMSKCVNPVNPIIFNTGDLGECSSFKPSNWTAPTPCWARPTPTPQNSWNEKFPEQTGTNKDGKIVPLKEFDIFDMLSGFLSSDALFLLMKNKK